MPGFLFLPEIAFVHSMNRSQVSQEFIWWRHCPPLHGRRSILHEAGPIVQH